MSVSPKTFDLSGENIFWVYNACNKIADEYNLNIKDIWTHFGGQSIELNNKYNNIYSFIKEYKENFILMHNLCIFMQSKYGLLDLDVWNTICPEKTFTNDEIFQKTR